MEKIYPEEVGLSSHRLHRIRPVMQSYIEQHYIVGVITAIARRGRLAHFECVGMRDIEAGKLMEPETIFRIYSMTKPITSVAVMMLYEEGHFRLQDPISRFIPAFQDTKVFVRETETGIEVTNPTRGITIWHLLTHTSGLSYGFDRDSPIDALYRETYKRLNLVYNECLINPDAEPLEKIIPEFAKLPLIYHPGTTWHYSISTDVLGYLVEVVSGLPFDRFLAQRIFDPLGMADTGFSLRANQVDHLAALYSPTAEGGLKLIDTPEKSPLRRPPGFFSGGGGLLSTTSDYLRFAHMLLNQGELDGERLLSRKTVEFMTINHLDDDMLGPDFTPGYGKGLGVKVLTNLAKTGTLGTKGMYGKGGVARTYFWVDPREELIGLLMLQLLGDTSISPADTFKALTYQAIID